MGWYSRALAKAPYLFIAVDISLALILGPLTMYYYGLPDFGDPFKGFEPRGTDIRGWMNAGYFIQKSLFDGKLMTAPGVVFNSKKVTLGLNAGGVFPTEEDIIINDLNNPRKVPRMGVVSTTDEKNLLLPEMLKSICELQQRAIKDHCGSLCNVTSLPDVIGELYNKSCEELTSSDLLLVNVRLQHCAKFYFNGQLTRECSADRPCSGVDSVCQEKGIIFRIFNDFTDKGFMENGDINKLVLSYSLIYIQWYGSVGELREFFTNNLGENTVYNDLVKIYGINLMIPKIVFQWYLIQDLIWYGLAMGVVILLLVIYLRSFVLMITVILNVVFSLLLAYWIYFMVIQLTFFPFINILAALLLIALGADDLFIFYDIWRDEKLRNPKASYEELISYILHKGGTSVFVTTFTTTAALLANFVSDVTAIRCFGAFAAICVFVNFLLFITWVPAIFVITDYAYSSCLGDDFCYDKSINACRCLFSTHNRIWHKAIPKAVNAAGPFWIILSLAMASGGLVATFWKPRLELPSTNSFRLLVPAHPFEIYEWKLKDKFRFEDDELIEMSCQMLWGAKGIDNGNRLDPDDIGSLVVDPTFDIYQNSTQLWMANLCDDLLHQYFIDPEFSAKECYWRYYKDYIGRSCLHSQSDCCGKTFPLSYDMSKKCMSEFAYNALTNNITLEAVGLPLFNEKGSISAFQLSFKTRYTWTANYEKMKSIYDSIEQFMKGQLRTAPTGAKHGWFTGRLLYEFRFFDLQMSLASGTLQGIGVSILIGFTVLLFTTMNIFLAVYAIVTIGLVLATTAGILALMGWELNTSEALTLTLSMGLSIDFTIHNGVAYKLADESKREDKVQEAISSVGSAITMAALTTLGAGAAMMCGSVMAYRQFGVFLVLTMLFSWFYATFFFMSLCSTVGPVGKVGDFSSAFTWIKKCATRKKTTDSRQQLHPRQNGGARRAVVRDSPRKQQPGHNNNEYIRHLMNPARNPPLPPRLYPVDQSSVAHSSSSRSTPSTRNSLSVIDDNFYLNQGFSMTPELPPRRKLPMPPPV